MLLASDVLSTFRKRFVATALLLLFLDGVLQLSKGFLLSYCLWGAYLTLSDAIVVLGIAAWHLNIQSALAETANRTGPGRTLNNPKVIAQVTGTILTNALMVVCEMIAWPA